MPLRGADMRFSIGAAVGLLLSGAEPALAADWWYIGTPNSGGNWLGDLESLTTGTPERMVWVWMFAKSRSERIQQSKYRFAINCTAASFRVVSYIDYALDGSVLESGSTPYAAASPVAPETMGETVSNFACLDKQLYEGRGFFGPITDPEHWFKPPIPKAKGPTSTKRK